jgi:hypothetical protein
LHNVAYVQDAESEPPVETYRVAADADAVPAANRRKRERTAAPSRRLDISRLVSDTA